MRRLLICKARPMLQGWLASLKEEDGDASAPCELDGLSEEQLTTKKSQM